MKISLPKAILAPCAAEKAWFNWLNKRLITKQGAKMAFGPMG